MSFTTHTIDLLVNDPTHTTRIQDHFAEGQTNLTANYYTVPGVTNPDGTPRALSIGQLVMALCLQRATELEAEIIKIVEDLNKTSEDLERLTEIETAIVNATDSSVDLKNTKLKGTDISYYDFLTKSDYNLTKNKYSRLPERRRLFPALMSYSKSSNKSRDSNSVSVMALSLAMALSVSAFSSCSS